MAQNYISSGDSITLTAKQDHKSGSPYRIDGFNGVALLTVSAGDLLSFQLQGIFEFELVGVHVGDLIFFDHKSGLRIPEVTGNDVEEHYCLFGRAVTGTDDKGKFCCRLLQSI